MEYMSAKKRQGELGEAAVTFDLMKRGYGVATPLSENIRYDLIVDRNGKLERIQVKSVNSDGKTIVVKNRSMNPNYPIKYTKDDFEWLACYDLTTGIVLYVPSVISDNRSCLSFKIVERGKQQGKCRWNAVDFQEI